MKTAAEIRSDFINFFKEKDHKIIPSAPVIPINDPTLIFTNAGMNQFKNIFLNRGKPIYPRIANSQKCIRVSGKHNDLEEVGKDTYHHTFFEMLGNWSFGDYYKKEAISYAWELLTKVWKFPKERLWATVYLDDDEAAECWRCETDIESDRILRFGEKDNFWEMGETGPCGPCSEIHYYTGNQPQKQSAKKINQGDPEYIELWNLVFIQYDRDAKGVLTPLPQKHVDTGAGLERIVAALQHKDSDYATDLFQPIIDEIANLTGFPYTEKNGTPHRVIADHIRMLSFAIGEGGMPSNEGRGYVIRRILRRAARFGRMLQMHEPFIFKLIDAVGTILGPVYPEVIERKKHIQQVIRAEEQAFGETIDKGLEIYSKIKQQLISNKQTVINGYDVFRLYDTFGFPVDLTQLIAAEDGFTVDMQGFNREMEQQRERARSAQMFSSDLTKTDQSWTTLTEGTDSEFVGYDHTESSSLIRRYLIADKYIHLILDKTPFYAEAGGEIGDRGTISNVDVQLDVLETLKRSDSIIHKCRIIRGQISDNPAVIARVDSQQDLQIRANHTATHLLQAVLRQVLGEHVHQSGSLVNADRLRFDLTHYEKINTKQLQEIEDLVNAKIRENIEVDIASMEFAKAREEGAMALFGEKYGDVVRVIKVGNFSKELCGGKHVRRTGDISAFKIISESSVAAGIRRIEAITGQKVIEMLRQAETIIENLNSILAANRDNLVQKVTDLIAKQKQLEKSTRADSSKEIEVELESLLKNSPQIKDLVVFQQHYDSLTLDELKKIGDMFRNKLELGIGLLSSIVEEKPIIVVVVTDAAISKYDLNAGNIVKELGKVLGGGGGGRAHLATAGGKDTKNLPLVIQKFSSLIAELVH
jgi:alanyl-tRNA synthetase